jgi:outer membrane protein assembly factor BamB
LSVSLARPALSWIALALASAACGSTGAASSEPDVTCGPLEYIAGSTCLPLIIGAPPGADGSDASAGLDAAVDAGAGDAGMPDAAAPDPSAATAYLQNPGHTSAAAGSTPRPPLARAWTAALPGPVSYPLIVQGLIVVVTSAIQTAAQSATTTLFALNPDTGATVWQVPLGATSSATLAYDGGRVFVVDAAPTTVDEGHLRAFDAATGTLAWEAFPDNQAFFAAPVAYRGIVYLNGTGTGGTLYAYDETTGSPLWRQLTDGASGSPAVSDEGVFIAEGCQEVAAFDRTSGGSLWKHPGSCDGGESSTPAVVGHSVYVSYPPNGNFILDTATGTVTGTFTADQPPAFDGADGFFVSGGALRVVDLGSGVAAWTATGDGRLSTAPLVVAGHVYVGSSTGALFSFVEGTGAIAWSDETGTGLTNLAAGAGLVAVPAGSKLLAYASGEADAGPAHASDGGCTWGLSSALPAVATGNDPSSVAVGDWNGDGHLDLAIVDSYVQLLTVVLGNGDGTFRPDGNYPLAYGTQAVTTGDLNGDGKPDLAVANLYSSYQGPPTVSVLLGAGDGTFAARVDLTVGEFPDGVAIADLNADGYGDLVVATEEAGISVLLGHGDGTFSADVDYPAGSSPTSLVIADMNGDGRLDVVVGNYPSGVDVLLGNGDGTFAAPIASTATGEPSGVAIGDFDGDGKPDVAFACPDGAAILLGNGDGTLRAQTTYEVGDTPAAVAIGDLDGDGKLDLAVSNAGTSTVSVLLGNGDGTFQPQQVFETAAAPGDVAIADLNGDGRPDVAVVDGNADQVSIFLGVCTP